MRNPGLDEPDMKATFTVAVEHTRAHPTVLSNQLPLGPPEDLPVRGEEDS